MRISLLIILIILSSCNINNKELLELPINIISSDTVLINTKQVIFNNSNFILDKNSEFLTIQDDRKILILNFKDMKILENLDLNTLQFALPEVNLKGVNYDPETKNIHLFFPDKSKVIVLNSQRDKYQEIELSGLEDEEHEFFNYQESFYYLSEQMSYVTGIRSKFRNTDIRKYINTSSFVGVFNAIDGRLQNVMGGFPQERKKEPIDVLSRGLFRFNIKGNKIFIRQSLGSPLIEIFDTNGNLIKYSKIYSSALDYKLYEYQGGEIGSSKIGDSYLSLIPIDDQFIASMAVKYRDENMDINEDHGFLLIEDSKNNIIYSKEIYPYQKLIHADNESLYFIRVHPNIDELILIKQKYTLQNS
ncbi:hypothetical protein Belba_0729 [Belliella baltica DSM 15883]|uniref:Uncharacterized protein n=1 Tax=Belliella baltica (strain DSM 15883 / CIP 108006 / LMG 21964 / BA134) TaxID=866536 RepID=I3Z2B4_BELBD|nr:hypothetical protein [Belliella baltica]AFL83382.1 hypothetical protein Belba_0729 [Belliella baltica DSM 15883]